MVRIAKSILIALIASVVLFTLIQLAFFFPWYMTIVVETFNLANVAANDNYVGQMVYEESLDGLRNRPIFRDRASTVEIDIKKSDGDEAIGNDDAFTYNTWDGEYGKPYRQRGEPVTVTISADYPLRLNLWPDATRIRGYRVSVSLDLPVSFTITTVGLKYYKDLEYDG